MKLVIDDKEIFFCIPLKAINSVEDFLKRRYNIYKDIIYHHRVIKTDHLLKCIVIDLIEEYIKNSSAIKNRDNLIPFDISGLWLPLEKGTITEKSNVLSQWNDSWLMTVLKQIYYANYYEIEPDDERFILKKRLAEFLRNDRCYYSLIKRSENFKTIDDSVKTVFISKSADIINLVNRINKLSIRKDNSDEEKYVNEQIYIPNLQDKNIVIDIKGTLDFIENILDTPHLIKGFVLSYISRRYQAIGIESFETLIKDVVLIESEKEFTNIKLYDTIVIFKNISVGLDAPIYFFDDTKKIYTLDEISGISDILRLISDYLPTFYIYIFIKNGEDIIQNKRENILNNIGKVIGEKIVEKILTILNMYIKNMEEENHV